MNIKNFLPNNKETKILSAITGDAHPYLLAQIKALTPGNILYIAKDDNRIKAIKNNLLFYHQNLSIITLPSWDLIPYDRTSPAKEIVNARTLALAALVKAKDSIIIASAASVIQKLPPKKDYQDAILELKVKDKIARQDLLNLLLKHGYTRCISANEAGEFAVRGGIVDIVGNNNEGYRIDFFDQIVDNIRSFDPITQISSHKLEQITLIPASEIIFSPKAIELFRTNFRQLFGIKATEDPMYQAISENRSYQAMENWLPLFYEQLESLVSYINPQLVIFDHLATNSIKERAASIADHYQARCLNSSSNKYYPIPPKSLWIEDFTTHIAEFPVIQLHHSWHEHGENLEITQAPDFASQAQQSFEVLKLYQKEHPQLKIIISCLSSGSLERMQNLLDMHQIHALRVENFQEAQKVKGKSVGLTVHAIERGFVAGNIAFISEQDLLGERAQIKLNKKKRLENFLQEASSLNIGELVVHNEHGIGRFSGLETISVLGIKRDCILITYAQGDKLYIPVENIDVITRYGSEVAALDKLGSLNWQTRKAKLKNRIKLAAIELIKVAAARELKAAPVIIAQENLYQEFCARFAYPETPDQMQAIEEVKQDLAQGKPMDRLICGDVGFGKTEVAMRAAFMCVFNDAMIRNQVAIVVPTTILAKQHYYTLQKRFAGFNVRIKLTSRMVSAKENKLIKQGLANGEVDIVVGTHALLAKDVIFKNLSMLIIDEEQHFGVAQKEKLKSLKANIHVLTLSATPIPRTLQMSLAGIKELSLIATPPLDRLAVRTSVLEFDDIIVREAILREYMRSGKCFYVCPHIADLANVAAMLKNLVPEIKFLTAHGQMPANELDDIMNNFYEGKFDLLLSTTIVESGLDIPGANTIFIHHAQKLGLSQLYQLRGRVGRGKVRAYAYLLSSSNAALSKDAVKRLEVMEKLNTLGAGFSIASHDMDIRGFGNLVGDEQSGHIKEVGIELYQKMLADEVAALQHDQAEKPSQDDYSISINLGLSVLIPQEYISDLALRLSLYQKIAALKDAVEIEQMAIEMVDRFGVLPIETKQLLAVVALKQLCRKLNINKIDVKAKGLLVSFYQDEPAFKEQFLKYILLHPKMFALRADHKLLINIALNPLNTDEIRNVLAEIIKNLPTFK